MSNLAICDIVGLRGADAAAGADLIVVVIAFEAFVEVHGVKLLASGDEGVGECGEGQEGY